MKISNSKSLVLIGLIVVGSCAQSPINDTRPLDPTNKRWITTGSIDLLIPNDFVELPVLTKDIATWKFGNERMTLYVEAGADIAEFSELRSFYQKQTDYKEHQIEINGVRAIAYTLFFAPKDLPPETIGGRKNVFRSGIYIPGSETRSRMKLALEGETKEVDALADQIFRSIKIRTNHPSN